MNGKTMEENTEKKLRIYETLRQTVYVYKTGFTQFMALSLISAIPLLGISVAKIVLPFSIVIEIFILIIAILSMYLMLRAYAGFFVLAKNILQGEKRTVKESFQQTKGLAGTYFSISVFYGMIILLPCLGIVLSYELIANNAIKFGIIGLLMIPLVFLATRYYLAVPSAVLFGGSGGLESSKLLVKGDFWQVLAIIALTQGIIIGITQGFTIVTEPFTELWLMIVIAIINFTFQTFTGPIFGIASTIMYLTLNQIKEIDVLPQGDINQIESSELVETMKVTG